MKKLCNELELCFGRSEGDARAVLKEKGVTDPTQQQLIKAMDLLEE